MEDMYCEMAIQIIRGILFIRVESVPDDMNRDFYISFSKQPYMSDECRSGKSLSHWNRLETVRKLNVLQINVLASQKAAGQDRADGDPDMSDKEIGLSVEH